jgi:hypothetical protein
MLATTSFSRVNQKRKIGELLFLNNNKLMDKNRTQRMLLSGLQNGLTNTSIKR